MTPYNHDHTLTTERPRIVSCRDTPDLLAALPELLGYKVTDSVIVMLFGGKRSSRAFRLDLPASESETGAAQYADELCRVIRDVSAALAPGTEPCIVIASQRTFAQSYGIPWRTLAQHIERRLTRDGVTIRELCCLAPDGWARYGDDDTPLEGRSLDDIAESPVALESRLRNTVLPDFADLGRIPRARKARSDAVARALAKHPPFQPPPPRDLSPEHLLARARKMDERSRGAYGSTEPALDPEPASAYLWFEDAARVVRSLCEGRGALSPTMTARLIRCAEDPDRWFQLAMGVLTRPEFVSELAQEMGPSEFVAIPIDLDGGADLDRGGDWETGDGTVPLPFGWSIRRLLSGISPGAAGQNRLSVVRERLLIALSETPRELRPGLLAFSAWAWWVSGSQTIAMRHLREALEIAPEHELALMAERLTALPVYSQWLFEDDPV